ncbi:MAG: cytochrome b5 domain-containing protein [Clostridiaceae bacterium]
MNDISLNENLKKSKEKIIFYKYMYLSSFSPYFSQIYLNNIIFELNNLENLLDNLPGRYENSKENRQDKFFTIEELQLYDGINSNKAYIAIDGIVYDVTDLASFAGGTHFGYKAGNDFTKEFSKCHSDKSVLSNATKVGLLK